MGEPRLDLFALTLWSFEVLGIRKEWGNVLGLSTNVESYATGL